jgi:hypothetical protein
MGQLSETFDIGHLANFATLALHTKTKLCTLTSSWVSTQSLAETFSAPQPFLIMPISELNRNVFCTSTARPILIIPVMVLRYGCFFAPFPSFSRSFCESVMGVRCGVATIELSWNEGSDGAVIYSVASIPF